ncbi:hypothetical protein NA78x_002146 [Anatilimnocola sp. NA78]|uniref:hypothetical protein n=1 Tax=Anatilimnocola sp. NA78 TaxID=3415683 RepID=UPI003CE4E54E
MTDRAPKNEEEPAVDLPPFTRDEWSRRDIVIAVLFAVGFLSWLGLVLWVYSVAVRSIRKSPRSISPTRQGT